MSENLTEGKDGDFGWLPMKDFKNLWEFRSACMRRDWHLSGQTHCRPYHFNVHYVPPAGLGKAGFTELLELEELKKRNKRVLAPKKGSVEVNN